MGCWIGRMERFHLVQSEPTSSRRGSWSRYPMEGWQQEEEQLWSLRLAQGKQLSEPVVAEVEKLPFSQILGFPV